MTTLVTGAGVVGARVAAHLQERGEHPVLFDVRFSVDDLADLVDLDGVALVQGDVTEMTEVLDAMSRYEVDSVVHSASLLTSTVRMRPVVGVRVNLMGTLTVLEAARLAGVDRMVFCSSPAFAMGRHPEAVTGALEEDFSLRTVSENPPSVYATMKLAAEWLARTYEDDYGLRTVSVRFGGVFGPWRGRPGGGPSRLLQHVIESAWADGAVTLSKHDLEHEGMDFVHASDAALGAVLALVHPDPPGHVYNISMGKLHTIREVVALLEERLRRPVEIQLEEEEESRASYGGRAFSIDVSRARRDLGYEPRYPMPRAIEEYLRWLDETRSE